MAGCVISKYRKYLWHRLGGGRLPGMGTGGGYPQPAGTLHRLPFPLLPGLWAEWPSYHHEGTWMRTQVPRKAGGRLEESPASDGIMEPAHRPPDRYPQTSSL